MGTLELPEDVENTGTLQAPSLAVKSKEGRSLKLKENSFFMLRVDRQGISLYTIPRVVGTDGRIVQR